MTEKRFRVSDVIEVTKPNTICDGDIFLTQKEATDLLNSLSEENEQLKQFKDNVQRVLQSEYEEYSDKVWSTWIKALSYKLRVDLND